MGTEDPNLEPFSVSKEYVNVNIVNQWVKRVAVAYAALAIALAIGLFLGVQERNARLEEDARSINRIAIVARLADKRAQAAETKTTIRNEYICSRTNQGVACQALFNRLANNLTKAQRHRLGCDVLAYLSGAEVKKIRKISHCPQPIKPLTP